jgi:hypothetical protein
MPVYYVNPFANHYVAEYREEGEDGREGRFAVDDEKGDVVDFEAVCEISHARSAGVGVSDDDHFVSSIDEFLEVFSIVGGSSCGDLTLDSWYM